MPRETSTPVERGPGSISSQFDSPKINVTTPGRQLQAQPTREEIFRDRIIAFGRGAAAAVSARSTIDTRLKMLKDRSMAKVEADLNRASRSFQQNRLNKANDLRRQMIVEAEAGDRSLQDLERTFRSRMMNASSEQEAQLWEGAWRQASAGVSRENEQARRQAFNSAKMTMQKVSLKLDEQLAEQPELRAILIGDGANIGSRVQNWMLEEIQGGMDLEALSPEDAELLIHQTVVQSANIADGLRSTHQKQVEQSNLSIGSRQLTSDIVSTLTNEQAAEHLGEQIQVTLRDRLGHLTPEQQSAFVRERVRTGLINTASGGLGIQAADQIRQAGEILQLTVDGQKMFTSAERQAITAEMMSRAQQTVRAEAEAEISQVFESARTPVIQEDGSTAFRRNIDAERALLSIDEEGIDGLSRLEGRLLAKWGLSETEGATSEESLLRGSVREAFDRARAQRAQRMDQETKDQINKYAVIRGQGGNINQAAKTDEFSRINKSTEALIAEGLNPLSDDEISYVKASALNTALTSAEKSAIQNWDGQTVEFTPENRELNSALQRAQAFQWGNEEYLKANNSLPEKMVKEKVAMLSSGDEERFLAGAEFVKSLTGGNGGSWKAMERSLSGKEADIARFIRMEIRSGQDQAPDFAIPTDRLMAGVSNLQSIPETEREFFVRRTPQGDEAIVTNETAFAESLASAIQAEAPDGGVSLVRGAVALTTPGALAAGLGLMDLTPQAQVFQDRESLSNQIQTLFQDPGAGSALREQYRLMQQSYPNLHPSEIASTLMTRMKRGGLSFQNLNGRLRLVFDPHNYAAEEGQSPVKNAEAHLEREYADWWKQELKSHLGLSEAPNNLRELLVATNPHTRGMSRPGDIVPMLEMSGEFAEEMQKSPTDLGGLVIRGTIKNGATLSVPKVRDNSFTVQVMVDGVPVTKTLRKDTPLSKINPLFYQDAAPIFQTNAYDLSPEEAKARAAEIRNQTITPPRRGATIRF